MGSNHLHPVDELPFQVIHILVTRLLILYIKEAKIVKLETTDYSSLLGMKMSSLEMDKYELLGI